LIEERIRRQKAMREVSARGDWLTAEQINALHAKPPADKLNRRVTTRRGRAFGVTFKWQGILRGLLLVRRDVKTSTRDQGYSRGARTRGGCVEGCGAVPCPERLDCGTGRPWGGAGCAAGCTRPSRWLLVALDPAHWSRPRALVAWLRRHAESIGQTVELEGELADPLVASAPIVITRGAE